MINLAFNRELDVLDLDGRLTFISAASGLVRAGAYFHAIADDSLHLASFRSDDPRPGQLTRLLEGELPVSPTERKKQKPDFEALVALPRSREFPFGTLLALGSGSRLNRKRGALIALGPNGEPGAATIVDLDPLFASFEGQFKETNIEGAIVFDGELLLFQRANAGSPVNAIVTFAFEQVLLALENRGIVPEPRIQNVELGQAGDVPLSFTDAAVAGGTIVFSAVAERTASAYDDGALVGAVLGTLTSDGRVDTCDAILPLVKVEGIVATAGSDAIRVGLVTDADDPQCPAMLFSATLPLVVRS